MVSPPDLIFIRLEEIEPRALSAATRIALSRSFKHRIMPLPLRGRPVQPISMSPGESRSYPAPPAAAKPDPRIRVIERPDKRGDRDPPVISTAESLQFLDRGQSYFRLGGLDSNDRPFLDRAGLDTHRIVVFPQIPQGPEDHSAGCDQHDQSPHTRLVPADPLRRL